MQLKQIARDALLKPLQAVSGIVERRHTLPILANVLLEQTRRPPLRDRHRSRDADHRALASSPARRPRPSPSARASCRTCCARCPTTPTLNVERRRQPDDGARRALALQPADAAGGGLSAHRPSARISCRRCRCRRRDLRALLKLGRVRDGAAGHPLLPERHAARRRPGQRCRRWPPTVIGCRGRASRSPASTRGRK